MRQPIDGKASLIMLGLCLIWGMQQAIIKLAAVDIAPLMQVALRSGAAAVLVWMFSRWVVRDRWLPGLTGGAGLAVGALFALEFLLVAEGLRWTYASHMAVLLYTAPLFAAIGLHIWLPDERLTPVQWAGVLLAFLGIAVTFLGPDVMGQDLLVLEPEAAARAQAQAPHPLLGDLLALGAGAAWGLTTVVIRTTRLSDAPATQTLFLQLAYAFGLLLPAAFLLGQSHFAQTTLAWSALIFQSVVVTFATYLTWFWLLRRYLAARLGVLSFMTPLFGVIMGMLLLDERPDAYFFAGAALVLVGLLLVNGAGWLRRRR